MHRVITVRGGQRCYPSDVGPAGQRREHVTEEAQDYARRQVDRPDHLRRLGDARRDQVVLQQGKFTGG